MSSKTFFTEASPSARGAEHDGPGAYRDGGAPPGCDENNGPLRLQKTAKILIIDDEQANVRLLERVLEMARYSLLRSTSDPRTAITIFKDFCPDLILTDLLMPHLDGFALMK